MRNIKRVYTPNDSINNLCLEAIKVNLTSEEEGPGWTIQKADKIGEQYRVFLYLISLKRATNTVPTKDIDTYWHYHILDTKAYHEDCQRIFGHYIHHYPYAGGFGSDDMKNLVAKFRESKAACISELSSFSVVHESVGDPLQYARRVREQKV